MPEDIDKIKKQKAEQLKQQAMVPDEPVYVDGAEDFSSTIDEHDVVLVDFYADWCGPCKMLNPTLEEIAAESDAVVAKVDIDANQQIAQQNGVRSVPTVQLYANGEQVEQWIGVQDKSTYVSAIEQHS